MLTKFVNDTKSGIYLRSYWFPIAWVILLISSIVIPIACFGSMDYAAEGGNVAVKVPSYIAWIASFMGIFFTIFWMAEIGPEIAERKFRNLSNPLRKREIIARPNGRVVEVWLKDTYRYGEENRRLDTFDEDDEEGLLEFVNRKRAKINEQMQEGKQAKQLAKIVNNG